MSTSSMPINLFDFEADCQGASAERRIRLHCRRRHRRDQRRTKSPRLRVVGAAAAGVARCERARSFDYGARTKVNLPVLIAPCGGHKKAHPEGEFATYRAAAARGTIMAVSANSNSSFEELAKAATGHLWLQLYPFRDRSLTRSWLDRAKGAGYEAICVTLDSQWPPKRERNIRNNYRSEPRR